MLYRVLQSQIDNPGKGDWVHLMRQDIQDLNPNLTFENIARMFKYQMKAILREAVKKEERSFQIFK